MKHKSHATLEELIEPVILVWQQCICFWYNKAFKMYMSISGLSWQILVYERSETFDCFCDNILIGKVDINKEAINNSVLSISIEKQLEYFSDLTM